MRTIFYPLLIALGQYYIVDCRRVIRIGREGDALPRRLGRQLNRHSSRWVLIR